jgi:hypothetical protein
MECDILLGQDWLERFGYHFQIPSLGISLPAYSETLVRVPTLERGSRMIEAQELQENVFCASGVVECTDSSFLCLVINCNPEDKVLKALPRTQDLPKLRGRFVGVNRKDQITRNHALRSQLRLAHVKEGEQEIRQICAEYSDYLNYREVN